MSVPPAELHQEFLAMMQYGKGLTGEQQAESYLAGLGMLCLARRYRGGDGEIDLVMQDGDTLVMVEVKFRPNSRRGAGLIAVTPGKQRRMLHAAQHFLLEKEGTGLSVRFDVVEITADGLLHLPNAFIPGE